MTLKRIPWGQACGRHTESEVWRPGAASACTPSSMLASRLASAVSCRSPFLPSPPLFAVSCPTATNVFARTCARARPTLAQAHL